MAKKKSPLYNYKSPGDYKVFNMGNKASPPFKMKGMSFGNSPLYQDEEGGDDKKKKKKERNNPCAEHYQKWADKCGAIDQSTQDGKNAYNRCRAQRQAALIKLECL